ncbi:DUF1453 family protein [Ktedonosporobacter rubrisoli]|uniref:DUF1453 family protein n=1 Tax=Ktedonosporobacter rubrisoli TaxID=2509675 RepID=A0A4P6JS26_KTERU|nr:DUF1453 family protein [Ktedonosporobacter rubrisoli]QBD78125.1 DUF1453 family protein [Ktedonosporobacter rubrisoli]
MSPNSMTLLIIVVVVIYMIVRQFQEQRITLVSLIILPVLVAYYTFMRATVELSIQIISPSFIMAAMLLGLAVGLPLGLYRGTLPALRKDPETGRILAKRNTLSICIWFLVFLVRVFTVVASYASLTRTSPLIALIAAIMNTLFLGNIVGERVSLFWRASRLSVIQQQNVQKMKW